MIIHIVDGDGSILGSFLELCGVKNSGVTERIADPVFLPVVHLDDKIEKRVLIFSAFLSIGIRAHTASCVDGCFLPEPGREIRTGGVNADKSQYCRNAPYSNVGAFSPIHRVPFHLES